MKWDHNVRPLFPKLNQTNHCFSKLNRKSFGVPPSYCEGLTLDVLRNLQQPRSRGVVQPLPGLDEALVARVVQGASFEAMRRDEAALMGVRAAAAAAAAADDADAAAAVAVAAAASAAAAAAAALAAPAPAFVCAIILCSHAKACV